ncbi:MAG: hypothetical protein ACOYLQ_07225 [Hyphomicrobiaceae bacterium]
MWQDETVRSAGPTPLIWQGATAGATTEPEPEAMETDHCPHCKTWTVTCCRTVQDLRDCRNLDETHLDPVPLVPA